MSLRELKQNFDITQLSDSLMDSFTIEKSTKILKNLDAKIDDYTIINQRNDSLKVDTSLTIDKHYKLNYLRDDNFELIEFSNTGHTYNTLSFVIEIIYFLELVQVLSIITICKQMILIITM